MDKKILAILLVFIPLISYSQDLPENDLQVNFNGYFDNFRVNVFYPSININRSLDKNTSISAGYLVDAISAASMKMVFRVDGVTSATNNTNGGADKFPHELRHQINLGLSRLIAGTVFSATGMYSIEHDYSAKTFAANLSIPLAKKNATLQFGYTGNWDKIFPRNKYWEKNRNTTSFNIGFSQILAKNLITQLDLSYIDVNGYMLDGYQVVRMIYNGALNILEPVEPDRIIRKAAGLRTNIGISKLSTLMFGYRYYWDTWDINSHTIDAEFKTHLADWINMSLGARQYFQTKAFFFKPEYTQPETFMGVEGSLNSGYTNTLSLGFTFTGNKSLSIPFLTSDKVSLITKLQFYHRRTDSPDWVMQLNDLYAYILTFGFKFLL